MLKHAKISDYKTNRRTVDRYLYIYREQIFLYSIAQNKESREFELDASHKCNLI